MASPDAFSPPHADDYLRAGAAGAGLLGMANDSADLDHWDRRFFNRMAIDSFDDALRVGVKGWGLAETGQLAELLRVNPLSNRSMFRFTIRDVLWLMVVAALIAAWYADHSYQAKQNFRFQMESWQFRAETLKKLVESKIGPVYWADRNPAGDAEYVTVELNKGSVHMYSRPLPDNQRQAEGPDNRP